MHDRRIDGEVRTFGNQGGLFLNAMVWWDHETQSLWSQPTGTAIEGPLAGVRLDGIPAAVQRWGAWLTEHPDTSLLMDTDGILDGSLRPRDPFATASEEVAGITVASASKAWRIVDVQEIVALNDALGDIPLLVYANKDDGAVHIYVRESESESLEFAWRDGELRDLATDSLWNGGLGIAVEGPLRGTTLRLVPHSSAFDWAWELHNPRTELWP